MLDYNFQTLSPIEFEALSRDLLQKKLNVTLQSFTAGRDGGVDLRYSAPEESDDFIVQCKRHITTYRRLKNHLVKKELPKVRQLQPIPKRYLLITSVGLTDKNKQELVTEFSPFILSTSDIYGRDDINNLLGMYPDIERQYYKLWLSSTNVLETILHSDTINKTLFEKDDILEALETYVENNSFNESIEIFKKKQLLVIAGEAGVGKTTLARMLVYNLLAKKKYTEFVYISRGVDEALNLYKQGKRQLFFFDDFLGRVAFEGSFERNEESDLKRFVEKIAKNKDKGLILTTREYILNQARSQYDEINTPLFKGNEYVIDIGVYTRKVKAQVLYNHLSARRLPYKYLSAFLKEKTYLEIIDHQNYNPRLISTILDEEPWKMSSPGKFPSLFLSYINDPFKLWKSIYERGVSEDARTLMKILLIIRTPIDIDKLFIAFNSYAQQNGKVSDYHRFEDILRELENTFIKIRLPFRYPQNSIQSIDFKNPSILDFLVAYYRSDGQSDLISIVKSAVYIDQLTSRFIFKENPQTSNGKGLIVIDSDLTNALKQKILGGADKLSTSQDESVMSYSWSSSGHNDTYSKVLDNLLFKLGFKEDAEVFDYLKEEFNKYNASDANNVDVDDHYYLLELFEEYLTREEKIFAISKLGQSIKTLSELETFHDLAKSYSYSELVSEWSTDNSLFDQTTNAILSELEQVSDDSLPAYREDLDNFASTYDFDIDTVYQRYNELIEESKNNLTDDVDLKDTKVPQKSVSDPGKSEEDGIIDMFLSLKE